MVFVSLSSYPRRSNSLFVCLFGPTQEFSLIWRRHNYRWRAVFSLPMLYSWQLSSDGSSACHTYCDIRHPLIMVIFEDPWHSHLMPSIWQWSCHYLLWRLRSVAAGIQTHTLAHATLHNCATTAEAIECRHNTECRHNSTDTEGYLIIWNLT